MKHTLTIKGNTGSVVIAMNEYSGHYEAFISMPYKASRWIDLHTTNKKIATNKAIEELRAALLRCELI